MTNMSLYHINQEYNQALTDLYEMTTAGELDEQTFLDTMEGLEGQLQEKAKNVGAYIRNLESFAADIKQAEEDMKRRRDSIQKHSKRLREYLLSNMQSCGIIEINSPYFDLKVKKTPAAVYIADSTALPAEYMTVKTTETPNKTELKKAIQAGKEIDGVTLQSGQRLEIK